MSAERRVRVKIEGRACGMLDSLATADRSLREPESAPRWAWTLLLVVALVVAIASGYLLGSTAHEVVSTVTVPAAG